MSQSGSSPEPFPWKIVLNEREIKKKEKKICLAYECIELIVQLKVSTVKKSILHFLTLLIRPFKISRNLII